MLQFLDQAAAECHKLRIDREPVFQKRQVDADQLRRPPRAATSLKCMDDVRVRVEAEPSFAIRPRPHEVASWLAR